jgi:hypothetical protein
MRHRLTALAGMAPTVKPGDKYYLPPDQRVRLW